MRNNFQQLSTTVSQIARLIRSVPSDNCPGSSLCVAFEKFKVFRLSDYWLKASRAGRGSPGLLAIAIRTRRRKSLWPNLCPFALAFDNRDVTIDGQIRKALSFTAR